jgi:hypothetical protein
VLGALVPHLFARPPCCYYQVGVAPNGVTFTPNFMAIGQLVQKSAGGKRTIRNRSKPTSLPMKGKKIGFPLIYYVHFIVGTAYSHEHLCTSPEATP